MMKFILPIGKQHSVFKTITLKQNQMETGNVKAITK